MLLQRVLHHVRDAVVSAVILVICSSVLMAYWPEAFGSLAIMTVTYELPRYPVLGTGIFASIYKSGATRHQGY